VRRRRRYWVNLLGTALGACLLFSAAGVARFSHRQALAYLHPRRLEPPTGEILSQAGIRYRDIDLITSDGLRLSAWYTPPQNGALILVAHGYGDRRPEDFYALFTGHGYGVLAWDFRAHGGSQGELSTLGYYEILDVEAALEFALAQPEAEHVGAWGGSMGAVTLIRAAAVRPEIQALVADSPFATLEDEFDLLLPYPLLNPLVRAFAERESGLRLDAVRPIDDISRIAPRPVFLIQGLGDSTVPPDSATRLYAAAGDPRQLWTEPGVPHLSMYAAFRTEYTQRVISFFDKYLVAKK
jgi:fermentation-respiration switch protein FrsA (DUF1100 family)